MSRSFLTLISTHLNSTSVSSDNVPGITECWRIFTSNVKPRRLFQEDDGVKGPLWFGSKPTSPLHNLANILRLLFALTFSPLYLWLPHGNHSSRSDFWKQIFWSVEWAKTPNAFLLESPGSLIAEPGKNKIITTQGEYAVTGKKPRWLLNVKFRGPKVVNWEQVKYGRDRENGDDLEPESSPNGSAQINETQNLNYTAISYPITSAEALIPDSAYRLVPEPTTLPDGRRNYTRGNRWTIARALLDEYARARKNTEGEEDDSEFIWLDEFCLCDGRLRDAVKEERERKKRQRDIELGQLADIFRGAERVVVFCHVEGCIHTDFSCPWVNRLFTLGEILHTPKVLCMTRTRDNQARLFSRITIRTGSEFRFDMQARAAKHRQWHLYNIMQHATNSGAVPWHTAIHSLIVEAIRRDDADRYYDHRFLGKALNGLLPRRSRPEDLHGVNGWADLAWLLELNQGYYNATMLAAVCKLADDGVQHYKWWGKPIPLKEGSERLEALVHAIPVSFRTAPDRLPEPALCIISPRSATISHWLQRDSAGLYRLEMRSLKRWAIGTYIVVVIIIIMTIGGRGFSFLGNGISLIYAATISFTIFQLLVGTIFVENNTWAVIDDRTTGNRDHYSWLRSQDPTFGNSVDWGARQLVPEWDIPYSGPPAPGTPPRAHTATLVDLRTGVMTKIVVTKRPNSMIALAVHGSGITCMLLDRSEKIEAKPTTAVKVGMANLPPFVLAQTKKAGTVYIGSHGDGLANRQVCEPNIPPIPVPLRC